MAGWDVVVSPIEDVRANEKEARVTITFDYADGGPNYSNTKVDPNWTLAKLNAFADTCKTEKTAFDTFRGKISTAKTTLLNRLNA